MRAVSLFLLMIVPLLASADIYRWVDDEGNVHYGDQPRSRQAERLAITSPAGQGDGDAAAADEEGADGKDPLAPVKETPFAQGKENATAQERCNEFRARVARYQNAGNLFIDNPDGSRHKLVPEERERLISRTRQQAEEACAQGEG